MAAARIKFVEQNDYDPISVGRPSLTGCEIDDRNAPILRRRLSFLLHLLCAVEGLFFQKSDPDVCPPATTNQARAYRQIGTTIVAQC